MALGSVQTSGRGGQIKRVEKIAINANYFATGGLHDLGLVKLQTSAKLGKISTFFTIFQF